MANKHNDKVRFEWLALRCQTGDAAALADIIAVMERPLLYYATSLTGNQDAALDVLQDVWLKVVHGIRRLKDPSSLRPWLYAITHGVAVDRIRRDYRRDKAEQAHLDDAFNVEEPSFDEEDVTVLRDSLSRLALNTVKFSFCIFFRISRSWKSPTSSAALKAPLSREFTTRNGN